MTFNTHAAFNRLMRAGLTQEQAEAVLDTIAEAEGDTRAQVATKADLNALENSLMSKIYFALLAHMGATVTFAAGLTFAIVKFTH